MQATDSDSDLLTFLDQLLLRFYGLREESQVAIAQPQRISLEQISDLVDHLLAMPSGGRFPMYLVEATLTAIKARFGLAWDVRVICQRPAGVGADGAGDPCVWVGPAHGVQERRRSQHVAEGQRLSTKLFKTFAAVHDPPCPHCGSDRLERLLSHVTIVRGGNGNGDSDHDDFAGMDAAMKGLESGDPRGLARMARHMSEEMGEDLPDEFEPMLRRMEAGEMPDDAEFEDASADLDDGGDALDED